MMCHKIFVHASKAEKRKENAFVRTYIDSIECGMDEQLLKSIRNSKKKKNKLRYIQWTNFNWKKYKFVWKGRRRKGQKANEFNYGMKNKQMLQKQQKGFLVWYVCVCAFSVGLACFSLYFSSIKPSIFYKFSSAFPHHNKSYYVPLSQ